MSGAVFTLYADTGSESGPPDAAGPNQDAKNSGDTVTSYTCTTVAGVCSISGVVFGSYWVVETTTPPGYFTAADQYVTVNSGNAGTSIPLSFTDPRQFRVIVLVCREATNAGGTNATLYSSSVGFDGATPPATPNSAGTSDLPSGVSQAQACAIGGATHAPVNYGSHSSAVDIPQ